MQKIIFIVTMSSLIAGTCIGAGILGLPLQTGQTGFYPSIIGLILSWALMFCTGYLMIDRLLVQKEEIKDMATLYEHDLGKWAKNLNTLGYIITFYGLIVAYLSGASSCIINILPFLKSIPYADKYLVIIVFIFASYIILYWRSFVLKFNAALTITLIILFLILIVMVIPHVTAPNLDHKDWGQFPFQFPILATSFGFQLVLPYICSKGMKLEMNRRMIIAILCTGTIFVLAINALWVFAVLGVLPLHSDNSISIIGAYHDGVPATVPISILLNSPSMTFIAIFFTLFAISTSYFGVGIGFLNYMKDFTSGIMKRNKLTDFSLTFLLPFIVALIYPSLFIKMLGFVGGFGVILVFGILPGIMAFKASSRKRIKRLGFCCMILSLAVFAIQLYTMFFT